MEADVDRKPVPALCAPANLAAGNLPPKEKAQKVALPVDDPIFAAARRMRIQDEVDNRLRSEEMDDELERMRSSERE